MWQTGSHVVSKRLCKKKKKIQVQSTREREVRFWQASKTTKQKRKHRRRKGKVTPKRQTEPMNLAASP